MKLYYDKLIRLPIKIGTLEFNQIVNEDYLKKFGVNILSESGRETVERSY